MVALFTSDLAAVLVTLGVFIGVPAALVCGEAWLQRLDERRIAQQKERTRHYFEEDL